MGTVLVKNIHTLVTMDRDRRELHNAAIFVQDQEIAQVGLTEDLPQDADQVLDLQETMRRQRLRLRCSQPHQRCRASRIARSHWRSSSPAS